jgi:hypothetical protein
MADDAKSGTGNPVVDALVSALGAFTKDSLAALRPVHAIDGVPFAEVALAYAQTKRAAEAIAHAVETKIPGDAKRVLLDPDEKLEDLSAFRDCLRALDILITLIDEDVAAAKEVLEGKTVQAGAKATFAPALALIAPAISAALGIGALFKTDVSEKFADIKIEDAALTGWLAKTLRRKNVAVLSGEVLAKTYSEWPAGGVPKTPAPGRLRGKLEALTTSAGNLYETSGRIKQRLKPAAKSDAKPTPEDEKLAGMDARLDHSIESVKAFDDAFKGIAQSVFRGDLLYALLEDRGCVLSARILAAAGTVRMETGVRTSTEYRAGVVVSYTLLEKDGVVDYDLLIFDSDKGGDGNDSAEADRIRKRLERSEEPDPNIAQLP